MKTKLVLSLVAWASFAVGPINAQTIEVTSTGVGIGTATPAAKLEVFGGSGAASQTTGEIFRLRSSTTASLLVGFDPSAPFGTWLQSNGAYPILLNPVAGNVGIGTTNPGAKLDVGPGAADAQTVRIQGSSSASQSYGLLIMAGSNSTDNGLSVGPFDGSRNDFIVKGNGNVGIGTATPQEKLAVWGNVSVGSATISSGVRAITPTGWGYNANSYRVVMLGAPSGAESVSIGYDPSGNSNGAFTGDGREVLFRRGVQFVTPNAANNGFYLSNLVLLDGNVGIGTTSPSYKLHVAGSVRATSFVADVNTYADFVFKPGYKLASLADVESSIQAHGHLPDIPSEAEVKRDGIDVVQMQTKLLQKVEELTLHLIAHEKTLSAQQQELRRLAEENASLRRTLSSLNAQ